MSSDELRGIIEHLFQTKNIESRKKGFRIFCDPETLATWRNFEGFLSYQKVRMCKEKEKENERFMWWISLRGEQKDEINEKRKASFLGISTSEITHLPPGVKRKRMDHEEL